MIFGAHEISTAALTAADVPSPDGSLEPDREREFPAIWKFAKTYPPPAALPRHLAKFSEADRHLKERKRGRRAATRSDDDA